MSTFTILDQTKVFDQVKGGEYRKLPGIYAIEATAACDLRCPMCLRTTHMTNKQPGLLDMQLLELMYSRGDFEGSAFIELQQAGEPTIHPNLDNIIVFLQDTVGVLVGLSTHGLNMSRQSRRDDALTVAYTLLRLDALTISIDSVDSEVYAKMRVPAKLENLIEQLDYFFDRLSTRFKYDRSFTPPFIELQLVKTDVVKGSGDVEALAELMATKGWDKYASIRTVTDSFIEMQNREAAGSQDRTSSLCINPWTSVNVTQDGDVLSCCYIFDSNKHEVNWYGNLWHASLKEIWNSDRVKQMRYMHRSGTLKDQCSKCYQYSPVLIHDNIISRLIRSRRHTK